MQSDSRCAESQRGFGAAPAATAVALVINSLDGGGSEKQMLLTAAGLQRRGVPCTVFWLDDRPEHPRTGALIERARQAGVRFCPPRRRWHFDFGQFWRLRALVAQAPQTVVWTWGRRSDLVALALFFARPRRLRFLVSLRSADEVRIRQQRWFWRMLDRTGCGFISNSWRNVDQLAAIAPGIRARSSVVYNAVEARHFAGPPRSPSVPAPLRIVMLGNVKIRIKGYDIAVELATRIKRQGLSFRLEIGGALRSSSPEGDALARLIREAGVDDIVHLAGTVSRPMEFLAGGDVFLMLSRFEGTPNALLEAMALGLPAVCTRVGDVDRFAVDREHLRIIDMDADSALAALQELHRDWPAALRMGAAGRRRCQELFTEERMLADTLAALQVSADGRGESV